MLQTGYLELSGEIKTQKRSYLQQKPNIFKILIENYGKYKCY